MHQARRYLPIEDYAAIGNLRTVALVGRDGAIDWFCFPEFDSPSVFAGLLDADRGGTYRLSIDGGDEGGADERGEQRYVGDSNVIETVLMGSGGQLRIRDALPLSGDITGCGRSRASPELIRVLRADGQVRVSLLWAPRFDYGRATTRIQLGEGGFVASGAGKRLVLSGVPDGESTIESDERGGDSLWATFVLRAGEERAVAMAWEGVPTSSIGRAKAKLEETVRVWERWANKEEETGGRTWAEPWHDLVLRSELALKMLTHADTGAITAAATTSLPETLGGVRNWDYRYMWIRDAAMTGQAFVAMGHPEEMHEFVRFTHRVAEAHRAKGHELSIMYSVRGEAHLPVEELGHLEGYRRSAPVLVGNEAASQIQHDVLGELVDAADELARTDVRLSEDIWKAVPKVADRAAEAWEEPDHGLWEMPLEPQHYVYSKLMTWVALDRAIRLADAGWIEGDVGRWREAERRVRRLILERGYSERKRAFTQTLDSDVLDASALMIPIQGLLPFDDPRVQGTIDRVMDELMENGLVRRYVNDDGLPGKEGGWVLCTTWLVDNLALSGRYDEARRIFEGVAARANHVGLFAEQIDPASGAFLGNMPQALSHIGFINSAMFLAHAQGREVPSVIPGTEVAQREAS
jgi:GH15 family glucan-1,4-alpha-glucosidase